MKYFQPYGVTDPDAAYVNGNPATGTMGSIPPAESIEHPQREIVNFIKDGAVLTPSPSDLHQLGKTIQSGAVNFGLDVGTANQVIVPLAPVPDAYYSGMPVAFIAKYAPTGPSFLDAGRGSRSILKPGNVLVGAGDWAIGDIVTVRFDAIQNVWKLPLAPSVGGSTGGPEYLNAPRDLYVNGTTGLDTNDGRTAAKAFKTIQRAQNETQKYNLNGFDVTIHVADGLYTESVFCGDINGAGAIRYIGNTSTLAACHVQAPQGVAYAVRGRNYHYDGFKVSSLGPGPGQPAGGIAAGAGGVCTIYRIEFGPAPNGYQIASDNSLIFYFGPSRISGNALQHIFALAGGFLRDNNINPTSITFANAVAFSGAGTGAFIAAGANGITRLLVSVTSPGNMTAGQKFSAYANGVIDTAGSGVNYYPGPTAGVASVGGQYI